MSVVPTVINTHFVKHNYHTALKPFDKTTPAAISTTNKFCTSAQHVWVFLMLSHGGRVMAAVTMAVGRIGPWLCKPQSEQPARGRAGVVVAPTTVPENVDHGPKPGSWWR